MDDERGNNQVLFHRPKHTDAKAIAPQARMALRETLVKYMTGAIRTYDFDDQDTALGKSTDVGVQAISRFQYCFHDGVIDHPISVSSDNLVGVSANCCVSRYGP